MLCDNCIKINVCKHKEKCNILEREFMGSRMDDLFSIKISCREYTQKPSLTFRKGFETTITADRPDGIYFEGCTRGIPNIDNSEAEEIQEAISNYYENRK